MVAKQLRWAESPLKGLTQMIKESSSYLSFWPFSTFRCEKDSAMESPPDWELRDMGLALSVGLQYYFSFCFPTHSTNAANELWL
ncbi:hypothetical protein MRB53_026089 [Persea americana]|uniref:Uncharacterized protein n=1 Tax=Persea americana TaxID=3435 RepID=A0ACC2LHD9_PERAE|nr:hypothetical protein MRB53_026089 [Persea americana]